jgi:hypothetical protein
MRRLVFSLILSVLIVACGFNQSSTNKTDANKLEAAKAVPKQMTATNELGMWKVANYAGDLGDNKNSNFITNTFAVWGTYSNGTIDHSEVKVKFLIDKVSFCLKLYEYGKKIVKKGDETNYKISVKLDENEPFLFTAKNVSDRIFIEEFDARKIIEMFNKGGRIYFSLANDSKLNPSTYAFVLENSGGFSEAMKKLSRK